MFSFFADVEKFAIATWSSTTFWSSVRISRVSSCAISASRRRWTRWCSGGTSGYRTQRPKSSALKPTRLISENFLARNWSSCDDEKNFYFRTDFTHDIWQYGIVIFICLTGECTVELYVWNFRLSLSEMFISEVEKCSTLWFLSK